jgi:hypothetical protein
MLSKYNIVAPWLSTSWTVRGSNPGGGEIFRISPDRPWVPSSLLYNGYWFPLLGVKRPGRGVDHPPSSNARAKERVELYLTPPLGLHGPFLEEIYCCTVLIRCTWKTANIPKDNNNAQSFHSYYVYIRPWKRDDGLGNRRHVCPDLTIF